MIKSKYTSAITDNPWWLAGGIAPANCVVAYQPKGASSLSASYINLATPGLNDVVVGTEPAWDSVNGWKGDGSTTYLYSPVTPVSTWTVAFRFSNRQNRNETYYCCNNIKLLHVTVPNLRAYFGNSSGISYFSGSSQNGTLIHNVYVTRRARLNDVAPDIEGNNVYGDGSGYFYIFMPASKYFYFIAHHF